MLSIPHSGLKVLKETHYPMGDGRCSLDHVPSSMIIYCLLSQEHTAQQFYLISHLVAWNRNG